MKTTISRPVPPGAAAAQPAPEPTARRGRVGSATAWKRTLVAGLVGGLVGGALVVVVAVTHPGRLRMRGAA
jgi:hypothetical protein